VTQKENDIGKGDSKVIVKYIDHLEISLAEYDRFNFLDIIYQTIREPKGPTIRASWAQSHLYPFNSELLVMKKSRKTLNVK